MRTLSKREQIIAIICGSFLLVYGLYQGVYKFWGQRISQVEEKIQKTERQLTQIYKKIHRGKALGEHYQIPLNKLQQKLSDEAVMSRMISEIQTAAEGIDIRLSKIQPQRNQKTKLSHKFLVNLSVEGGFNPISEFLYILQDEPYLFEIDELNLRQKSRRHANRLQCRLTVSQILFQ